MLKNPNQCYTSEMGHLNKQQEINCTSKTQFKLKPKFVALECIKAIEKVR